MGTSQKHASRATSLAVVGLGALLMAPKCGADVTVPVEDSTPPLATLFVLHGVKIDKVPEDGLRLTMRRGEEVIVYASGKDEDGGIRKVSIVESATATCAEGTSGEERRENVVRVETSEVKPGELGNSVLYTSLRMTGAVACAAGLTPRAKRYAAYAIVENHQGGTTSTPTLIVDVELSTTLTP